MSKLPTQRPVADDSRLTRALADRPIYGLILSDKIRSRVINALLAANIVTIGELVEKTANELLRVENLGTTALEAIQDGLAHIGLSLGMVNRHRAEFARGVVDMTGGGLECWSQDGGPVFPNEALGVRYRGMSLRDYFALAALPACIQVCARDSLNPGQTMEQRFAETAWAIADAMLEKRNA